MDRRRFLAVVSTPALAAIVQSCGSRMSLATEGTSPDGDDTPDPTATPATSPPSPSITTTEAPGTTAAVDEIAEARSELERAAVLTGDPSGVASAYNAFGNAMYELLVTEQPTANLVFSPTSIALALAMTSAGARGQTLEEMLQTLQIGEERASEVHHDTNALTAELAARSRGNVALAIANSLWGQLGLRFEQAFLDLLATEYGAGMNLVDYTADPEAARVAINRWVSEHTNGRIPELLASGVIRTDSRLTLVNAVYMKAPWFEPFEPASTADIPFIRADGGIITVPAMRGSRTMRYAAASGWQAIELPYEGGDLVMTILLADPVLPRTGFAPDERKPAVDTIASDAELWKALPTALETFENRYVDLTLPKFDIESNLRLEAQLGVLGMRLPFSNSADFSGMTTDLALTISSVIHQANITVDEAGTEAAASTAVILVPVSGLPEPAEVIIDHPFLFAIRDWRTGAILFLGRVADPSA